MRVPAVHRIWGSVMTVKEGTAWGVSFMSSTGSPGIDAWGNVFQTSLVKGAGCCWCEVSVDGAAVSYGQGGSAGVGEVELGGIGTGDGDAGDDQGRGSGVGEGDRLRSARHSGRMDPNPLLERADRMRPRMGLRFGVHLGETEMPIQGMLDQPPSPIDELAHDFGTEWSRISAARVAAQSKVAELNEALSGQTSPDTSVVVYGSLAREEFTQGSDLDWTLLVDGQANPQHQKELLSIRERLSDLGKGPGREKTFGKLTFSHPLLHLIGGEDDTNANTTRRVLFLLEAFPIGKYHQAFHRVRKHILHRYLSEDHGLARAAETGDMRWIPLFLLNDMARYWRTMTVDFAYKQWDRGNEGYALRSLKLGVSRKLIYASGLLACFWCDPAVSKAGYEQIGTTEKSWVLGRQLNEMFSLTPLERFARFFLTHRSDRFLRKAAGRFFETYDEFLGLLEDAEMRRYLETLSPEAMNKDDKFQAARAVRTQFEGAVKEVFLDPDSLLYPHTLSRGVF